MSARRLLGIGRDAAGNVAPVFASPDHAVDALGHHRAVVEASRRGGFLPAPLDMPSQDPLTLAARIAERRQALAAALDAACDMVEIGVRVRALDSARAPASDGRAFLRRAASRMAALADLNEFVSDCIARVEARFVAVEIRRLPVEHETIRLAIKTPRCDAPELAAMVEALATDNISFEVTGPWPLYSFGAAAYLAEGGNA